MPIYSFSQTNPLRINVSADLAAGYNSAVKKILEDTWYPLLSEAEKVAKDSVGELISNKVWDELIPNPELYRMYVEDLERSGAYLVEILPVVLTKTSTGFERAVGYAAAVGVIIGLLRRGRP